MRAPNNVRMPDTIHTAYTPPTVGIAPVISDGCTKIDAPMMMPTTSAVACRGVIDRESMARETCARVAGTARCERVCPGAGRAAVRLCGRFRGSECASNHARNWSFRRSLVRKCRQYGMLRGSGFGLGNTGVLRHEHCFFSGPSSGRKGDRRTTKELTMNMQRRIQRSLSLGVVAVVGLASIAAAQWGQQYPRQGRELFEWRGTVDREVQIVMRGDRVWTNNIGRTEPNDERSRAFGFLPRTDGDVFLQVADGRGSVQVIQQPNARNGYTTIVRILDPRSGQDSYRVVAYWRGEAGGDIYRRGGDIYGRGDDDDDRDHGRGRGRGHDDDHGRGNDGIWSRDRDDDRDGRWDRRSMLHWSGNVDDELQIRLQNGRVEYVTVRGAQPTGIRVNTGNTSTRGASGTF